MFFSGKTDITQVYFPTSSQSRQVFRYIMAYLPRSEFNKFNCGFVILAKSKCFSLVLDRMYFSLNLVPWHNLPVGGGERQIVWLTPGRKKNPTTTRSENIVFRSKRKSWSTLQAKLTVTLHTKPWRSLASAVPYWENWLGSTHLFRSPPKPK